MSVGLLARSRLARLAPLAAGSVLVLLALLVRALPHPTVFASSGVHPSGPDAYYHLRRIAYTVVGFPRFLDFDPYLAFPDGGRPIWTPLFDFTLAALARLWLGAQTGPPLEGLLMWASPLFGAASVLVLFLLARRVWGPHTAWLAALLLALLPAHFVYSRLGELDHHGAVALAATLLFAAGLARIQPAGAAGLLSGALPLGAAQAFALLLWPGCLLAVAAVDAALLTRVVVFERRGQAVALARRCALAHGIALLAVAPFAWGNQWERWGSFSPLVLSRFQPVFLAAGALCFGVLGEAFARIRFPGGALRRALAAVAVILAVLALGAAAAPGLLAGTGDAWQWLARREAFQASVAESQPLFWGAQGFEAETAGRLFSRLVLASPLLVLALALGARGREDAPARLFLAGWTGVWLAAALLQRRFVNELSAPFALLVAVCAMDAARAVRRVLTSRARIAAAALASLAAAGWLLAPLGLFYAPYLANVRRALAGEPARLSGWQPEQRALARLARWLAEQTPPTAGYWDASARPEYGVLAAWGDGHLLRYVAQRPMVQDNFGDDVSERSFALAEAYFAAPSEAAALRIAEQLRARYVVVRGGGSGHSPGYSAGSLFARLHRLRGAEGSFGTGSGAPPAHVPALARHRLLFDADVAWGPSNGSRPSYKVFEIVPGARITGRARPGAEVRAELRIAMGRRGRMIFSGEARAGADGRYELVVPYPNDIPGREIRPGRAYQLRSDGREVSLPVTDTQVREGARVEAPPLAE
ncbi:MAG: STT3 domain-containing protein [Candidatus Limnocylindria bacterium]